jgi:hypothetical protein
MVPEVKKCTVSQCFYNKDSECGARAVLVGSDEPVCETFIVSQQHTKHQGQAGVGACHIDNCQYNQSMSCHACSDIEIVFSNNQAWCNTFESK